MKLKSFGMCAIGIAEDRNRIHHGAEQPVLRHEGLRETPACISRLDSNPIASGLRVQWL